jgi:cbb3-type cytochrome oxidase subunit 3
MFRNLLGPSEWSALQLSGLLLFFGMFVLMLVWLFVWKTKGDYASAERLPLSDGDELSPQREVTR